MLNVLGSCRREFLCKTVVLSLLATRQLVGQVPNADFTWRMPDHFGALKSDGSMSDFHWNAAAVKYDPAYVSPPDGWPVEFDGCSQAGGSYSYTWTVDGGVVTPRSSPPCKMTQQFYPVPAAHTVTLTVTNSSGQSASATHRIVPEHWLIVSIGDSYSSGEGAPDGHQQLDVHQRVIGPPLVSVKARHSGRTSGAIGLPLRVPRKRRSQSNEVIRGARSRFSPLRAPARGWTRG